MGLDGQEPAEIDELEATPLRPSRIAKLRRQLRPGHLELLAYLGRVGESDLVELPRLDLERARKLVKLALVERVEEDGFKPGYRLTATGRDYLAMLPKSLLDGRTHTA